MTRFILEITVPAKYVLSKSTTKERYMGKLRYGSINS